jgi:predicted nucleic acid-binding protein
MTVFADTSALYAMIDRNDANHQAAASVWPVLVKEHRLLTTNYVIVEACALLQHRLGVAALRDFQDGVIPLLQVSWVGAELHRSGIEAVLAAARKKLSLVDCVSFQTMRQLGVRVAYSFDSHFAEHGFAMMPGRRAGGA